MDINKPRLKTALAAAAAVSLSAAMMLTTPVLAQTDDQPIFGSQLMSDQERQSHRLQMLNANTPEERERIRADNHERMQKRAEEQGITLPEVPPARGMGQGMQQGRGQGMQQGQGQGMQQGRGQGMQQGQGQGMQQGQGQGMQQGQGQGMQQGQGQGMQQGQ